LTDAGIAGQIVEALGVEAVGATLEIGPGTGILTRLLLQRTDCCLTAVEIDSEAVIWLRANFPQLNLIQADILSLDLAAVFDGSFSVIGNFPYNISSQIFFRLLNYRSQVKQIVCMLQKEVALRLSSPPGSRNCGILSVILQTYYDISYLFTVPAYVFSPPPKVQSGVIRLTRNNKELPDCNEQMFIKIIKTAFSQRRKTLRNSLKALLSPAISGDALFDRRPEQLGVSDFEYITRIIEAK